MTAFPLDRRGRIPGRSFCCSNRIETDTPRPVSNQLYSNGGHEPAKTESDAESSRSNSFTAFSRLRPPESAIEQPPKFPDTLPNRLLSWREIEESSTLFKILDSTVHASLESA